MKVKQQIINFYQILKELPDNEEYNVEGIRNRVSMKADNLLFTLDNKGNQGIDIDAKIFSFLSFVKGYDYNRQIKKFPTEKQNVSLKHILT